LEVFILKLTLGYNPLHTSVLQYGGLTTSASVVLVYLHMNYIWLY